MKDDHLSSASRWIGRRSYIRARSLCLNKGVKMLTTLRCLLFASLAFLGAGTLLAGETTVLSDNSKEAPPPHGEKLVRNTEAI